MEVLVFGPESEGFECAIYDEPLKVDKYPSGLPKKKRLFDRLRRRFKKEKKCTNENGTVGTISTAVDSMWSSVSSIASSACSEHNLPLMSESGFIVELDGDFEFVRGYDKTSLNEFGSETTVSTAAGLLWSSASSIASSIESSRSEHDMPLIQQRLLENGVETCDIEFVRDYVSKEVIGLYDEEALDEDNNVSHVKTGIWQVTILEDDGTPKSPYYVVTGVTMDDQVDTKKLRKVIFAGEVHKRRPKLSMAPKEIAEKLAGFQSGTMSPICHTKSMKLFFEESIVKDAGKPHKINVGSGMFGQCLSIDLEKFLKVAKANPEGFVLCSIRKAKSKQKQFGVADDF